MLPIIVRRRLCFKVHRLSMRQKAMEAFPWLSFILFYAVITSSQAFNPQRSDNDIASAFIAWVGLAVAVVMGWRKTLTLNKWTPWPLCNKYDTGPHKKKEEKKKRQDIFLSDVRHPVFLSGWKKKGKKNTHRCNRRVICESHFESFVHNLWSTYKLQKNISQETYASSPGDIHFWWPRWRQSVVTIWYNALKNFTCSNSPEI